MIRCAGLRELVQGDRRAAHGLPDLHREHRRWGPRHGPHRAGIELLWEAVSAASGAEDVGFCLDTCHAHASGEDLDDLVDRIQAITGRIDLVHVNDSRDAAGSGADRHANLGTGQADPEFIMQVIRDAAAPVIIETTGGVADHIADLDWIRTRL